MGRASRRGGKIGVSAVPHFVFVFVFVVVWCGVLKRFGFLPSQAGIGEALSRRLSNVDVQLRK